MTIDYYFVAPSPPCRSVNLCIKALGLTVNPIPVNIFDKEHLGEEFTAINPTHTVPTIVDDEFKLWESRAILTYLVSKYGPESNLYTDDPEARAIIDKLLYFDTGTLTTRMIAYVGPVLFGGQQPDESKLEKIQEAVGYLNGFLEGHDFVAGDSVTVADFALITTVTAILACGIDLSAFENVTAWVARCTEQMDGFDECSQQGADKFGEYFQSKISGD